MNGYNYITNVSSPNYWAGGNTIEFITIHWWGDPATNPSAEGVVNWLCNRASQVSAHIVATGTGRRVWQLVNDTDRAWHAGTQGNARSIGIELDPRARPEDYDVAAEVIANLWKFYGRKPLRHHSSWVATRCPGNYDLAKLERMANEKLNPKPKPTPAPKPINKPVPASVAIPGGHAKFKAKLDKTEVWDLTTNPNYKSVKTLKKGEEFIAYATIKFNNSVYYITEYSHSKGIQNGVNSVDLEPVVAQPKPTPAPAPKPVETPKPIEKPQEPSEPEKEPDTQDNTEKLLQRLVDAIKPVWELLVKLWNAKY